MKISVDAKEGGVPQHSIRVTTVDVVRECFDTGRRGREVGHGELGHRHRSERAFLAGVAPGGGARKPLHFRFLLHKWI